MTIRWILTLVYKTNLLASVRLISVVLSRTTIYKWDVQSRREVYEEMEKVLEGIVGKY